MYGPALNLIHNHNCNAPSHFVAYMCVLTRLHMQQGVYCNGIPGFPGTVMAFDNAHCKQFKNAIHFRFKTCACVHNNMCTTLQYSALKPVRGGNHLSAVANLYWVPPLVPTL